MSARGTNAGPVGLSVFVSPELEKVAIYLLLYDHVILVNIIEISCKHRGKMISHKINIIYRRVPGRRCLQQSAPTGACNWSTEML